MLLGEVHDWTNRMLSVIAVVRWVCELIKSIVISDLYQGICILVVICYNNYYSLFFAQF